MCSICHRLGWGPGQGEIGAVDTGVSGNPLEQCEVGFRLGLGYAGLRQGLSSKIPCPQEPRVAMCLGQ